MKKGEKLSILNTIKKEIKFDRFRALPISAKHINTTQLKHHIKKEILLTTRDIEILNLVKKGSNINVTLNNKNITISFLAKALQNGKLNDIITVRKSDGKKIKVKVIGKNRVEIQ
jgi:flagella basal body P-ring formation protein FlgA